MSYLSLDRRVPEPTALDLAARTWLYELVTRAPLARTAHRHFVAGVLRQGVRQGLGLDLGTGPGYAAVELARLWPEVRMVGMDLAAHMVERAQARAERAGLDGRGMWPQADGHHLPFADHSFDLVVSSYALHHWQEPVRVFDEIARILVPGGRYYIADVCREMTPLQRMVAYASIPVVSLPFGSYRGGGGYYESVRAGYTQQEARALLAQSALPSGEVRGDSTRLLSLLAIASKGIGS
jgi:ubiquinone/menaquinone biosynthesis C-methylase UbiE